MHLKLVFFVISSCPKVSFIPAMYPTVKCLFSFYIYIKKKNHLFNSISKMGESIHSQTYQDAGQTLECGSERQA